MDENGRCGPGLRRPMAALDDAAVVALATRGSCAAWEELVVRFGGLLRAITHRYRLTGSDAADVAQSTWLQLHRHIGRLREPEKVAGWLASTARHECARAVRRREEPVDPTTIDVGDPRPVDPTERLIATEGERAVHVAIRRLSPRCQRLLQRLVWDEQGYERVAAELAMPVGSIGPTRQRCLASLARQPEVATHLAGGA